MKNPYRVISVYPNFANQGGAQDVALQLAVQLNNEDSPIVLTHTPQDKIITDYLNKARYLAFKLKNVSKLADKNTVFLSHHRKCTSILLFFNLLLGGKLRIIHVAHTTFTNLKLFSSFPKNVIAVSNGVKDNLIHYFGVPENHIQVIFNGIKDTRDMRHDTSTSYGNEIRILLPGRICSVKQQVEIVKQTKGKLSPHIHIYFAGKGEDEDFLKEEIAGSPQYHYVGFINMDDSLDQYDYVCLFSQKEGLGMSLIYGLMFGKPLITNTIPAVLEVNKAGETGFAFANVAELITGLNHLPKPGSKEYSQMSVRARKKYEEKFTEERMIASYKRIVENVLTSQS